VAELGEPEQEPFGKFSWWGPSSPKTDEEFEAMPLPALVDFLTSWVPSEEGQASRAGLGRQFASSRAEAPRRVFGRRGHVHWPSSNICPSRDLGLDEAARRGTAFDVSGVLGLCEWLVKQPSVYHPKPVRMMSTNISKGS